MLANYLGLIKFKLKKYVSYSALSDHFRRLILDYSPFRAVYVENHDSIGCLTPWAAKKEAMDWKLEEEQTWETDCGKFEVRVFGVLFRRFG